jgi:hypothetical protein
LEIISRRTAWTGRRRMLATTGNYRDLQNTDTDAITLDLTVN